MHWPEFPKERSCHALPTVKKLLEQKRKRDMSASSSSSSSSSARSSAGAPAQPVSPPAQATVTDVAAGYPNALGERAPLSASDYGGWSVAGSHQPLQQDCPFSPAAMSCFPLSSMQDYNSQSLSSSFPTLDYNSQSQAHSPALSSSLPTQDYNSQSQAHSPALTSSYPTQDYNPQSQAYSPALTSSFPTQDYNSQSQVHSPALTSSFPTQDYNSQSQAYTPALTSSFPTQDYNSQSQAHSPALTSSFPTQDYNSQSQAHSPALSSSLPTQDYSATMSIHTYPGGAVTPSLTDAMHSAGLQPLDCSWVLAGDLGAQTDPGSAGRLNPETLDEARRFLRGMDDSEKTWQDEDGDTILHIYTAKGLREYALAAGEELRALGGLETREHKGKTALLVAAMANQPDIVHDLLWLGADVNACDVKGKTALHLAAAYGLPDVMQALLSFGPVDLEARNFEGQTPLHCAAISHIVTATALGSAPPAVGDPALQAQAQAQDKLSCLQLLISCGASLLSQDIKSNETVLHLAVKEGNIQLVRYLLGLNLADMQAFVNMKAHGNTALHMAAGLHGSRFQEEVVRLLLSRGADAGVRNLENEQPAHLLQSDERGGQLKLVLKRRPPSSRRRITSLQDQD